MQFIDWIKDIPELVPQNINVLLKGMWVTLEITLFAVIVGIVWGTLLAIMRLSNKRYLRVLSTYYINAFRSIPLLLVLLWFYLAFPILIRSLFQLPPTANIQLFSAIIAFSLFEASYYAEIIRAGIQGVPRGQYHAALALGMTHLQSMKLIVLPQAFRMMAPLLLTQGIILFQDTSLVYVMSLADFFRTTVNIGTNAGSDARISMVLFAGIVYFILCFSASIIVQFLKKRGLR